MKKTTINSPKKVSFVKKVIVTTTILCGLVSLTSHASETSQINKPSTSAQIEQTINAGSFDSSFAEHNLTKENDIKWRFNVNKLQLDSLDRYTAILKNSYVHYRMQTPLSEQSAGDFYQSLFKSYPHMYHIVMENGFNLQARDILYSNKPASSTTNLLFEKQTNLALNKMEHFQGVLKYIESNGDHKFMPLFNNYELASKTTR